MFLSSLTVRERFLRTMRFEHVEPPSFELGAWGQTIERWLSEGMPQEPPEFFYGWEGPSPGYRIDFRPYLPINVWPLPSFKEETIEENERYVTFRDSSGRLRKALKPGTARGTRLSMDQYLEFPVKDMESFEEMRRRYDPHNPGRYPDNWPEVVRYYREHADVPLCLWANGTVGFYWLAREWMGTVDLSKAFFKSPRLIHSVMEFIADLIVEVSKRALKDLRGRIDYFNLSEDFASKGGPLISPRLFEDFVLPHMKRVTSFMRSEGVSIIWLDSDGDLEALLPQLIDGGVTCIWPLEVAAGMDPIKIRREYGRKLVLSGGLDKREIAKDEQAIERELSKIPSLVFEGGYLPTLDHSFPPDISYRNFVHYLKVKREMIQRGVGMF